MSKSNECHNKIFNFSQSFTDYRREKINSISISENNLSTKNKEKDKRESYQNREEKHRTERNGEEQFYGKGRPNLNL